MQLKPNVYEDSGRLFIRAFLLDASTNINRWGVNKQAIPEIVKTFIGKPFVLNSDYDHPTVAGVKGEDKFQFLARLFKHQEQFRIGNITDVIQTPEGDYDFIAEVTHPNAKEAFRTKSIPFYVSPSLYMLDENDPDDDIKTAVGVHVAVVDDPAYTVKKARIDRTCGGDVGVCMAQLKTASVEPSAYTCACPGALLTALADLAINSSVKEISTNSNAMTDITVNPLQAEVDGLKAANAALKSENDKLKLVNGEVSEALKQVSASVDSLKKDARKSKIASILTADLFENAEAMNSKIDKMTDSNLSVEEIADTFKGIREAKLKVAKVDESSKPKFTASNGQKNASVKDSVPMFVKLSEGLIK